MVVTAVTLHILGILCNSQTFPVQRAGLDSAPLLLTTLGQRTKVQSLRGRRNLLKEGRAIWSSRVVEMQALDRSGRGGGGRTHRGILGEQGWPRSLLGSLRKILCQTRKAQPCVTKT